MPTSATAELYFIAGAMVLIFIICAVAVYIFFRQLKREGVNRKAMNNEEPPPAERRDEEK